VLLVTKPKEKNSEDLPIVLNEELEVCAKVTDLAIINFD